ncbi:unnamed protein product [Diabrotica balteata]|uniref:glycogenin glucosyltransferase n=1 Tax=Diabrotica balteata TaxID=107213 RepID=A0A9P0E2V1_DIABA|nr:unnamed protein product [Diabrotica balteata]
MGGGYAWVTLATNDSYSLGSLVLAHSLKQVGTKQQLAVLITPGVTNSMRSKLNEVFNVVKEVNILDSKDEANLRLLKRPELGITFTKLHCWRLTQFEKCVFLDADTLILENCDELFEREELSAAPDIGWPDCFNSGVFVYRPSNETYEKLIQFALEKGSFDGGDQGLLNLYFSDWAHKDISKHLPFIYNLASTACYSYLPAFKQFGKNAKIIHFIGASKPWLQYFNTETRKVHPSEGLQHLEIILQRWWDIFCNLIHPALTPDMAGLAGAFANLTLGQPRTPEQQALDDHLRRQGWEVGNIDYLGRDSFDNIWSKICETLALAPDAAPTVEQPQEAAPVVLSATVEVSDSPQSKTEPPAEAIPSPQTPQPVPSESKDPLPTEAAPKVPPIQSIPEQPVSQKPVVEIPSAGTAPPEAVASQQESPKSETPIQQPTPSEQESQQVPVETNQSVQPSEVKEPATGAPSPAAKTIEPVSTEPPKEEPTVVSESPKQVSETPQADLPKAADSSKESTDTLTAQSVSEKPPTEPVTVVSQSPEKPEDQKPTIEDLKSPEVVSDSPQVPTQEPVKEASKDSTQEVQQETPKSPKEDQKVTPAESPKEPQKEILTQAPAEAQKEVPKVQQKEPVEAPKESPKEAQKEAPKESPKETTKEPPKEAPKESPKEAPKESPKEAPKESPKEAPKESPKEAPKVPPAQKEAPKESPKGAQKEAPKQSPKEAQKETSKEVQKPKESSEKSPKESPKELEKPSPKQTSTPKQSPVSKKGKKDPPKEESKQKETAELPSSKVTEPTPPTTPVSPPVSQEPSSPSPVSKAELQVSASVPETPPPAPSSEAAKGPTPPPRKSGGGKKK